MENNTETVFGMLRNNICPGAELVVQAIGECLTCIDEGIEDITRMIVMSNHKLVIPLGSAEKALDILLNPLPLDCDQRERNLRAAFHIIKSCKEMPQWRKDQFADLTISSGNHRMIRAALSLLGRVFTQQEKEDAVKSFLAAGKIWQAKEIARYGVSSEVFGAMIEHCKSRKHLGKLLEEIEAIKKSQANSMAGA